MQSSTIEEKRLIKEISHIIVLEVAPEELDLFDELVEEYYQNPKFLASRKSTESPLGFGMPEFIASVTTATVAMVKVVIDYLVIEILNIADNTNKEAIDKKIKSLFSNKTKDKASVTLSKEQMQIIHRVAVQEAVKFGISPQKAKNMAKAMVGTLSLR